MDILIAQLIKEFILEKYQIMHLILLDDKQERLNDIPDYNK